MIVTSAPDKVEIVQEHNLKFLKEFENKRPVRAVRGTSGNTVACVSCHKPILDDVFVGVQYTYDPKKFSSLCVPCAGDLGIIQSTEETGDKDMAEQDEPTKRKRGRPAGSTKAKTVEKKESEKEMGLNLKGKIGKAATAAPAQTTITPEEKVTTLLAEVDEHVGGGLELDEDIGLELDETTPPWKEESPVKVEAGTNGKKADTPADLRSRIESVDVPKAAPTGLTKADVQDIVQACLADAMKTITSNIKEIKTEISKNLSAVQADVRAQVGTIMENIDSVGVYIDLLTKKLDAALADEEPTATVTAPVVTVTATTTTAGHEAKKATATAPKPAAPAANPARQPFAEFVNEQVGIDGCRLEPLADMLLELGYFKTAPENKDRFLADLTSLLRSRGFKVVDFFVEKV